MRYLSALLVCVAMALLASTHSMGEESAVRFGALYNLTGGMAPIDAPACRGSMLAAKLINAKGGILGGRKLELVVIDTKSDIPAAEEGAKKLVSLGVTAGLGYCDTDYVIAAAPVFQSHGIPFLTTGATDPALPERIGRFMFMTPFGDNDQAYAMADFAYEKLGARNAVLWINSSTDFTRVLARYFKERFHHLGGAVDDEERFTTGQDDFTEAIERLKKLAPRPDVVFISGNPQDAVPTVTALRRAGIALPILSGDGFDSNLPDRLPSRRDADGVYFAAHAYYGSERPEVLEFVKAYKKEYGKDPENSYAALGFDAVNLLAEAVRIIRSADGASTAEALPLVRKFEGVSGEISFSGQSRVPIVPVNIVGIRNGTDKVMTTWVR